MLGPIMPHINEPRTNSMPHHDSTEHFSMACILCVKNLSPSLSFSFKLMAGMVGVEKLRSVRTLSRLIVPEIYIQQKKELHFKLPLNWYLEYWEIIGVSQFNWRQLGLELKLLRNICILSRLVVPEMYIQQKKECHWKLLVCWYLE